MPRQGVEVTFNMSDSTTCTNNIDQSIPFPLDIIPSSFGPGLYDLSSGYANATLFALGQLLGEGMIAGSTTALPATFQAVGAAYGYSGSITITTAGVSGQVTNTTEGCTTVTTLTTTNIVPL